LTLTITHIGVIFTVSFAAVLLTGPAVIAFLHRLKMQQSIGSDAPQPESHRLKHGTPTMGGVLFVVGVFAAILLGYGMGWLRLDGPSVGRLAAILGVVILHMVLGFVDDYLKATRGKALGLKARQKLTGQLIIALLFVLYLALTAVPGVTTDVALFSGHTLEVPPWLYYPLVVILMVGLSNSTNLADGLDGLAAGLAALAFVGVALTAFTGAPEVAYFGWAMSGACVGFLAYNGFPARVFMGDTGSLAIGAGAAAMAVIGKEELPVFLYFFIFIVETLSVMIQVVSFKSRGKRVFKNSPLHHHFELCGWKEVQIVQRFWIAGVIALWMGLIFAKSVSPFLAGPVW
jgi:phospho-N-acetylmuramoyl-pentapeptide-transferase